MKRRQHELGLYSILGMENRHIARLLRCGRRCFCGLFSLVCGLAAGIILSKLMLMLLLKLLHFPVSLGFSISIVGIVMSTILFAVLFLLALLRNLIQLHKSKPVELLRSSLSRRAGTQGQVAAGSGGSRHPGWPVTSWPTRSSPLCKR